MKELREIYCCGCNSNVPARLTDGKEIYPHRPDLSTLPFWKCDTCKNYVGCHHKTHDRTKPLGNIPTREIMEARKHIHRILDPLWKEASERGAARGRIYAAISQALGYQYHTGEIKTLEEARKVYAIVQAMKQVKAGETTIV